jgi:hypothetical protein
MKGLITVVAATLATSGFIVAVLASGTAAAAGSADLSIRQTFSGGSTSGATLDTVRIHNGGSSTANNVNLAMFIKTTSAHLGISSSGGGVCELEPAPPGYTIAMATCQLPSIASTATEIDKITWAGTAGLAFTSTVNVGSSIADPKLSNNISTASSWFGPRADLKLTQTATSGPAAGKAKIVSTVVNRGPSNANALQLTMEVNSPGYTSVIATSNITASCQFIPPATGYNRAVDCTTNSLHTAAKWVVTFAFTGHAGDSLKVKNKVSANNPPDPVTKNNTATSSTTYHA